MKPWFKWTVVGVVVALLAAGALRTLSARKTKQADLLAQQAAQQTQVAIDLAPTDLVQAKTMDLPINIAITGPVKAVNTAVVKARVSGELQGLTVREGDSVKAGQILGRIDPTESESRLRQAQQQVQALKAQLAVAQRSHDNNVALVAQGFISNTALVSSQANLNAALANHASAQSATDIAAKNLSDTVLRSPINGQVAQRLAQTGERVGVEARIVEIVDLSRLEIESALSASDAQQVKVGQKAQLHIEGVSQTVAATVARINPSTSAGSRAVLVYLSISPDIALRQGLFAEGALATSSVHTLAIPLTAVRTDKPKPYVQVVVANQVQHINVTLGARSQTNAEVLVGIAGVPEGATVIAGAAGIFRPGTQVKVTTAAQEAH